MTDGSVLLVRLPAFALVCLAVSWSVSTILSLPPQGLYATAQAVRRGEAFPRESLLRVADSVPENTCRIEARESAVVIRLNLVGTSPPGRTPRGDEDLIDLRNDAQRLIECSPASSVAWLGLYLATVRTEGLGPFALELLSTSLRNAPHEAWLQMIRLPLLLPIVDALPEALRGSVMDDYFDLVDDGLDGVAAVLILRAAPALRGRLIGRYCDLDSARRELLARELTRLRRDHRIIHPCLPDLDITALRH